MDHDPRRPRSWRNPGFLVLAYALLLAGNHLLWAAFDRTPPIWDQAIHMEKALQCARMIGESAWGEILTLSGRYPPLTHCAAGLLHLLIGPGELVALSIIQGALIVVLFATYRIGVSLGSPTMGVAAALIVGVYTKLFLESRVFMLDLPLTAFVTVTVLALLKTEGFARLGWSLTSGALAGLGLLAKWTSPLFVGPVGLFIWLHYRRNPQEGHRGRHALLSLAVMLIVAAPWYGRHLLLPGSLLRSAYVTGVAEGDPSLGSIAGWIYYVWGMIHQLGPPFAALFAVGLLLAWLWRIQGLGVLLVWLVVPLVALTFLRNKDFRFTMPSLPAVALLSVAWMRELKPKMAWRAVTAVALLALAQGAHLGWSGLASQNPFFPSVPPLRGYWPITDILELIARDHARGAGPATLSVVPDHPFFSRSNFRYYATLNGVPLRLAKAWTGPPLFIHYVVTKSGDQGPPHTTRRALALMARIEARDPTLLPLLQPLAELPLPDGERARLYKVMARPVPGLTTAAILARLEKPGPQALDWALRESEGLRLDVEPLSEAETLSGHVRRLVLRADSALVGDFRRKPAGVRVHGLELRIEDARLNLHALALRGAIELLDARRLVIGHALVTEADIGRALAELLDQVKSPAVSIRDGGLEIAGEVLGVRVEGVAHLEFHPEANGSLSIWIEGLRFGRIPIPSAMVNAILWWLNPLVHFEEQPVEIRLPRLRVENGRLRLTE